MRDFVLNILKVALENLFSSECVALTRTTSSERCPFPPDCSNLSFPNSFGGVFAVRWQLAHSKRVTALDFPILSFFHSEWSYGGYFENLREIILFFFGRFFFFFFFFPLFTI